MTTNPASPHNRVSWPCPFFASPAGTQTSSPNRENAASSGRIKSLPIRDFHFSNSEPRGLRALGRVVRGRTNAGEPVSSRRLPPSENTRALALRFAVHESRPTIGEWAAKQGRNTQSTFDLCKSLKIKLHENRRAERPGAIISSDFPEEFQPRPGLDTAFPGSPAGENVPLQLLPRFGNLANASQTSLQP